MEIVIFLTHLTELLPVSLFVELNDDVKLWSDDDCDLIVFVDIEVSVVDITILGATVVDGVVFSLLVVNVDDMVVFVLVWGIAKMSRQLKLEKYNKDCPILKHKYNHRITHTHKNHWNLKM